MLCRVGVCGPDARGEASSSIDQRHIRYAQVSAKCCAYHGAVARTVQAEKCFDSVGDSRKLHKPAADLWRRYYTLSIILGTVAFSYGSVPMYKMVPSPCHLPMFANVQ